MLSFVDQQPPNLKEDGVDLSSDFMKQGWVPALLTAYGNDVYIVLTSSTPLHQAMILYYDANNWHNAPQTVHFPIQPDVVSVAAAPGKQLFLLTSDGHLRILSYGDGGNLPQPDDVSLQNPVSPPLENNGTGFTVSTPIATPVPLSSQLGTSAQADLNFLTVSSVGSTLHLYVVDNPNHRIMDLEFLPAVAVTVPQTTPTPTPTSTTPAVSPTPPNGAGAVSQPSLKVVQQFASSSILSSVKSAMVNTDRKQLSLLTQGGGTLTTVSAIDRVPSCLPAA